MRLYYRKYGQGPPLIILHGLYGSSDNWISIARKLKDNFTVYLPDQRNHGLSPHHPVHTYDSMRDDLFELTDRIGVGKFFLAGHSMGGKTAISFALKWPDKIYGLLIADISPFANENQDYSVSGQHLTILRSMLSLDLSEISSRTQADKLLKKSIPSEKIRGLIIKNLRRISEKRFSWKLNVPSLLNNLNSIMDGINRPSVTNQRITGFPVIFLKGSRSGYLPESDFRDIETLFPAAEIITLKDAGHWIHHDNPDEVVENIIKLLTGS